MVLSDKDRWVFDAGQHIDNASAMDNLSEEMDKTKGINISSYSNALTQYGAGTQNMAGGFNAIISNAELLGDLHEGELRALKIIQLALGANVAAYSAYSGLAKIYKAMQAKEAALAAAETSAMVAAQQYQNIAAATAASAIVLGSFTIGFAAGSSEKEVPAKLGTPEGRLHAIEELKGVGAGG